MSPENPVKITLKSPLGYRNPIRMLGRLIPRKFHGENKERRWRVNDIREGGARNRSRAGRESLFIFYIKFSRVRYVYIIPDSKHAFRLDDGVLIERSDINT